MPDNIKTEDVVKKIGQSLQGKKLILKPVNSDSSDNEVSITIPLGQTAPILHQKITKNLARYKPAFLPDLSS